MLPIFKSAYTDGDNKRQDWKNFNFPRLLQSKG